eukprot:9530510-Lingulodinium_polyedra.AAC.1
MAAGCLLLGQRRPSRHGLERVVGKASFCHTFRPGCRGSFGCMFHGLLKHREARLGRAAWAWAP